MKAIERFQQFEEIGLDNVMLLIKNGTIKCGRYSHLVKVDKKAKIKNKLFFENKDGIKDSKKR